MGNIAELDMLTRAGILEFDAEAFVKGEPQPGVQTYPKTQNNVQTPALKQMKSDVFEATKDDGITPAHWKKVTAALLASGLLIFFGYKRMKGKYHPIEYLKKHFHPIEWVKGLFKKKA